MKILGARPTGRNSRGFALFGGIKSMDINLFPTFAVSIAAVYGVSPNLKVLSNLTDWQGSQTAHNSKPPSI